MELNYPIKFTPILKERIWGGNKLHTLLGKQSSDKPIGESWEISGISGSVSVVENGSLKGKTLQELIDEYTNEFLGEDVYKRYGNIFPLLIKFIDAKEDLSVQLHPNNKLALQRHNSFGKEEMWYIMQADKESRLLLGFDEELSEDSYLQHLEKHTLIDVLHEEQVKKGEVYYIPTGRVHAIGKGIVLAEIQQSSDITYRIYDWDRKDTKGNSRELHTDLALEAIDFSKIEQYKVHYHIEKNMFRRILDTNYFKTKILDLRVKKQIVTTSKDSFVVYMCVKGNGIISTEFSQVPIKKGETILIPAKLRKYTILPEPRLKLIYIKAV